MKKLGSGGGSNKLVNPSVRTGSPSKGTSPGAADQLGQATAFRKEQVDAGPAYNRRQVWERVGANVGKGGPGAGRTIRINVAPKSLMGSVNPGLPEHVTDPFPTFFPGIKDKPMGSGNRRVQCLQSKTN